MVNECTFAPDYAVAPGQILEEILEVKGISKVELASRTRLSPKTISLIIAGKAPVTPETSIQFERVLGMAASIWNNLESNYRLFNAKEQDREELVKFEVWSKGFPLREMVKRGWIERTTNTIEKVSCLLNFFGVGSVTAWEEKYGRLEVSLRRAAKYKTSRESLAAWIRKSEIEAAKIETKPFNSEQFNQALVEIRGLSCDDPNVFEPKMIQLMASAGVALVFIGELKGTHLCGATKWLSSEKAMIALSLRYKTDDQLWFTFFHEAGHLKLHSKKLLFIDGTGDENQDKQEQEADQFASSFLIPSGIFNRFKNRGNFTAASIRLLAKEIEITPGIIVGRLQHENILGWNTTLNHLKCHFELAE